MVLLQDEARSLGQGHQAYCVPTHCSAQLRFPLPLSFVTPSRWAQEKEGSQGGSQGQDSFDGLGMASRLGTCFSCFPQSQQGPLALCVKAVAI